MANRIGCNGCCITQSGCASCARCLPKYLCVDIIVVPGPYTDLTCCDVDYYGNGAFSFRLINVCDSWSGSGTCGGLGFSIDFSVVLDASCNTIVSSSLLDADLTFDGTLPAGMSGSLTNASGDEIQWEITRAAVVPNPLAKQYCSPCSCATCLPEKLCAEVTVFGHFVYDAYGNPTTDFVDMALSGIESAAFEGCGWSFDAGGVTAADVAFTVKLKDITERICGIDFSGTMVVPGMPGGAGTATGVILLEGSLHPRKFHGTLCAGNAGESWTQGVPELLPCPNEPCPEVPPQNFVGYIDQTFDFTNELGTVVGSVRIRDLACGSCSVCQPPVDPQCCPDLPDTLLVSASRSGESSTSGVLTRTPVGFTGSVTVPGCLGVLTLLLRCEPDLDPKWYLDVGGCHFVTALVNDGGDPVCNAFVFETSGVFLNASSTCCLPDHPPDVIPIVITA